MASLLSRAVIGRAGTCGTVELFDVHWHGHESQCDDFIVIGADIVLGNDVSQEVNACCADPCFVRRWFQVMKS